MKNDRPLDPNLCSNTLILPDLSGEESRVITLDPLAHLDSQALPGGEPGGGMSHVTLTRVPDPTYYIPPDLPPNPPPRPGPSPGTMQRRRRILRRRLG